MSGPRNRQIKFSTTPICRSLPRKPLYTAWNVRPKLAQWSATLDISSVMSRKVNPSNPPVWVERNAVGRGQHWTPMAERIGMATVREHRPKPDMS